MLGVKVLLLSVNLVLNASSGGYTAIRCGGNPYWTVIDRPSYIERTFMGKEETKLTLTEEEMDVYRSSWF